MTGEYSDPHFQTTFKEVVVILNDGNEMLMSKCINCNFITRYHSFSKINHWRHCPSKWSFKFINQNEVNGFIVICLKCQNKIHSKTYIDRSLENHRDVCSAKNDTHDQNHDNLIEDFETNIRSDGVECVRESLVSQREVNGQLRSHSSHNTVVSSPGYKMKYLLTSNGLERYAECEKCRKAIRKPKSYNLMSHRNLCPLQSELLFTVTTVSTHPVQLAASSSSITSQPFDMTISSSVLDDERSSRSNNYPTNSHKICFICNTTASENFVNLYEAVTKHSQTQIFDFVWKFMDNQPSVRDDSIDAANSNWSSVCARCLDRINEYDLACVTANKFEQELRADLFQTETFYARRQQYALRPSQIDTIDDPIDQVDDVVDPSESEDHESIVVSVDCPEGLFETDNIEEEEQNDQAIDEEEHHVIELSDNEDVQTIELSDDDE